MRRADAAREAPDGPQALKARALRLLARREHSRAELARKLAGHAQSAAALESLLDDLVARRQLSDERYAESRTHALSRKYGAAHIRRDLQAKGIAPETVERLLRSAAGDELARARAAIARKYREPATQPQERARRARFLLARGYSHEIIRAALGEARSDAD